MWQVMCSPRPPMLSSQRHMDLHVWSHHQHSYIFQVSSKSVQGFWSHDGGGVEIWPFPSLWLFAFIYSSLCYGTNRDSELFVESRKYFVPHVYLAAPLEVTPLEFPPKIFENYNSWTIVVVIYMMTSLAVLIEHRLVKNRRTQGYNINRASIASRSKKQGHSTD